MPRRITRYHPPQAPDLNLLPLVNAGSEVARWLDHYWCKLNLSQSEAKRLAITDDRGEFARWTGRRLNPLALGCYCYLPSAHPDEEDRAGEPHASANLTAPAPASALARVQLALPGFEDAADGNADAEPESEGGAAHASTDYRHLIFVEPDLLPLGIEVTVAHELIHLSDRVQGNPRKHHCHGYDSISVDEAAITGRDPELLRELLREETSRREAALRELRPYRYLYVCPHCAKEYPRVRRYARPVSCGRCARQYNPAFQLQLRDVPDGDYLARLARREAPGDEAAS